MKASAVMTLLVVAACASGGATGADVGNPGGGDSGANVRHVQINGADVSADAQSGVPVAWHTIAASADRTWEYLPIAYSRLGLRITRYDSTTHLIEGERLRSRADFGGKGLKSMLNCGEVEGMPNVTRFEVNIMVRTALRGSATSSAVASVVTATAKPDGVAGTLMPCTVSPVAATQVAAAVTDALAATK